MKLFDRLKGYPLETLRQMELGESMLIDRARGFALINTRHRYHTIRAVINWKLANEGSTTK